MQEQQVEQNFNGVGSDGPRRSQNALLNFYISLGQATSQRASSAVSFYAYMRARFVNGILAGKTVGDQTCVTDQAASKLRAMQ